MKVLVVFVGLLCLCLGEDQTVVDKAVGKDVVEAAIDLVQQSCVFEDDKQMLRRIAYLTKDGEDPDTFLKSDNNAGIWQVTEDMFKTTLKANLDDWHKKIEKATTFPKIKWTKDVSWNDMTKPLYGALAARLFLQSIGQEIPWDIKGQAFYWVANYASSVNNPENYLLAMNELNQKPDDCDGQRADVVFVLDGSGSIGSSNFDLMKQFVQDVINEFRIAEDGVKVGVIQYSGKSHVEFNLRAGEKANIIQDVANIGYLKGVTNTAAALDQMREMFTNHGRTNGEARIGIVMTDGKSTNAEDTRKAANRVHADKLTTFAVGVTSGVDKAEVNKIGTDPDCIHVSFLDKFTDIAPFTSKIQEQACRAPAEVEIGKEIIGNIISGKRIFFKIKIRRTMKITIKLRMTSGASVFYFSYKARQPNPAFYDFGMTVTSSMTAGQNIQIPYPEDEVEDEIEAYYSLLGTGWGAPNAFVNEAVEGILSGASLAKPAMVFTLIAMVLAILLK